MKILVYGGNKHELYLCLKNMLKAVGIIFGVERVKFGYDISIDDITIFVRQCNTELLKGYKFDYYYTDVPMAVYRVNGGVELKYLSEVLRLVTDEKGSNSNSYLKEAGCALNKGLSDGVKSAFNFFTHTHYKQYVYIRDVIYNDPATIVFWSDGTKTVVKADDEPYDPEKGLAMAMAKKELGNKGNYYETFKKWLPDSKKKGEK